MKTVSRILKHVSSLFLITICLLGHVIAQDRKPDIIIKKDNSKVEAVIQEIDKVSIKYKKFSDRSGPVFTLEKNEVVSILYGNGEVEVISQPEVNAFKSNVRSGTSNKKISETPINISSLNQKKQKFVAQYLNTSPEKLTLDVKKYKRRSITSKVVGTAFATAGLATIIVGILNYSSANKKAESTLGGADPGLFFAKASNRGEWNGVMLPHYSEFGLAAEVEKLDAAGYSDPNYRSKLDNIQYRYKEKAVSWYGDKLRKDNMKITLLGVGIGGVATAVYLVGASAGWKYKLLHQELRNKGFSFKIEPQWQPNQRMMGLRFAGTF